MPKKTEGLTLKEAVESGHKFRRPCWPPRHYLVVDGDRRGFLDESGLYSLFRYQSDITATDYELIIEPREWFLNVYEGVFMGTAYSNKEKAEKVCGFRGKTIKVREVIDED